MIIIHLTSRGGQPQHVLCNCTIANSLLKEHFFFLYFYSTLTPPTVTLQHKDWPLYQPHNDSTSSYFRDQQVQLTSWMDRNKTVSCRPLKTSCSFSLSSFRSGTQFCSLTRMHICCHGERWLRQTASQLPPEPRQTQRRAAAALLPLILSILLAIMRLNTVALL